MASPGGRATVREATEQGYATGAEHGRGEQPRLTRLLTLPGGGPRASARATYPSRGPTNPGPLISLGVA